MYCMLTEPSVDDYTFDRLGRKCTKRRGGFALLQNCPSGFEFKLLSFHLMLFFGPVIHLDADLYTNIADVILNAYLT